MNLYSRSNVPDLVRQAWDNGNKYKNCTLDEAIEKMRKALYKSNGACNTELAVQLAVLKDTTVDDVIRLGNNVNENGEPVAPKKFERMVFSSGEKFSAWRRLSVKNEKRLTQFKDTFYRKFLESKGLWGVAEALGLDRCYTKDLFGNEYMYRNERCRLNSLLMFAKANVERLKQYCPDLLEQMCNKLSTSHGSECSASVRKMIPRELAALNQAPVEVLEGLNVAIMVHSNFVHLFTNCYWATWSNSDKMQYYTELGQMMWDVLDYMGIGMYHNSSEGRITNLPSTRKKGTIPFAQKVLTLQTQFDRMLKKGLDVNVVRAEMCEVLKELCNARTHIAWSFFPRIDAPQTYEVAKPKSKSTKSSKNSHEPKVEYIEGIGEVRY